MLGEMMKIRHPSRIFYTKSVQMRSVFTIYFYLEFYSHYERQILTSFEVRGREKEFNYAKRLNSHHIAI